MENADTGSKAELSSLTCCWVLAYSPSPPRPVLLGCVSVLVTLTLCCHHCPKTHLFIYWRVRERGEGGWDILKALCN